jgi:hypothetical protein
MKSGSFSRKDNKPLTIAELRALLNQIPTTQAQSKPVVMSCDEEGNEMLKLVAVDISKTGQVTLWPAHV